MEDKKPVNKKLVVLPLILGISSFCTFALYFYSANHAPYTYTDIILVGPILSFIGVIVSIITRSRKLYPTLWTSGLIVCLFSLVVCVLIIILLIAIMAAAFNGNWI